MLLSAMCIIRVPNSIPIVFTESFLTITLCKQLLCIVASMIATYIDSLESDVTNKT